jgi:hypothetical protein
VNANLKADTTEALLGRKKSMHISALKYRIDEIRNELQALPAPRLPPSFPPAKRALRPLTESAFFASGRRARPRPPTG